MRTLDIPGSMWINFIVLVAAAIFIWVKVAAAERAGRRKPESKPVSPDRERAIE